jgi:nicotinamide-nucleotide amidase
MADVAIFDYAARSFMSAAILTIGTELTRGEIVDSNACWLASALTEAGFEVRCVVTVADDIESIVSAITQLAQKHRVVLATGGLGPTSDDLTAAAAARAAEVELVRDASALLAIRRRVEARGREVTPEHEKQADLPSGAEVLTNSVGTAPGFALQLGESTAFFLPGVPGEMRRMFQDQVLSRVRPSAPNNSFVVRLRTYGLGESAIAGRLASFEGAHPDVTLGYRAHIPQVDVKVQGRASSPSSARELVLESAREVRELLGDVVFGEGDEELPNIVARAMRSRGWRLALAESCTGGLISYLLTSHAGASEYLIGSAVTYANSAKTRLVGVSEDTLRGHGAVSAEVAAEMAEGARRVCEVDVGLSVTGIAGPSGGSTEKPVGLCYWAVAHPGGTLVRDRIFYGDRNEIQTHAAFAALDLLRRIASGLPEDLPHDARVSVPPAR